MNDNHDTGMILDDVYYSACRTNIYIHTKWRHFIDGLGYFFPIKQKYNSQKATRCHMKVKSQYKWGILHAPMIINHLNIYFPLLAGYQHLFRLRIPVPFRMVFFLPQSVIKFYYLLVGGFFGEGWYCILVLQPWPKTLWIQKPERKVDIHWNTSLEWKFNNITWPELVFALLRMKFRVYWLNVFSISITNIHWKA